LAFVDGAESDTLFSQLTTPTLAPPRGVFRRKEVTEMFKQMTDELLDLTATVQGYRRAYLAHRIILCCTCTMRWE
jgi:hypothetical protein